MKPVTCEGCPLAETGQGYAFGEGPDDATICFVGEALGAEEAARARPFVGGAGRVLNYLFQRAGVKRSRVYITNAIKCRPPANRTPTPLEVQECMKRHEMLNFLQKFNLVVPLGNVALQALTGDLKISKWRGSIFEANGLKILPTYHPAAVMRQEELIPIVVVDLQKVLQEGWTKDLTLAPGVYETFAQPSHISQFFGAPFAFDVETRGLEPKKESISLLGLSNQAGTAYVFHDLSPTLADLFGAEGVVKIGHNIMFDISHLEANGIPVAPPYFDTMLAHHLLQSDLPCDLAFCASIYTRVPYWKHLMRQDLETYNATDVDVTYRLYETFNFDLKSKGLERVFNTTMKACKPLYEMKKMGVRVDENALVKWHVALNKKITQLEKELTELVGDPIFNWKSSKQLSSLLYEKMKLPKMYRRGTDNITTNEEALSTLYEAFPEKKELQLLLSLRKYSKLLSTYFSFPEQNRVHSEYLLHGTATGRLSSHNPNLQNVPKGPARSIYIPDPGKVFVSADYNQIELRIAAFLAQEEDLLLSFDKGEDVHRRVASLVYNVPIQSVTDEQRFRAKFIVYGLGYGRGASSIARAYKMPVAAAQAFIDAYFTRFPNIKKWREECLRKATHDGFLVNPFGRRRYFFGQQIATKVYNFLPQSTAADILLETLVLLYEQLPKEARLVLTVHDSVLVECPEEALNEVVTCLKDVMQRPIDVLQGYCIPVKIGGGKTWAETDK